MKKPTEPLGVLSIAALGVVFGDIGTSPLYAFQQCFSGDFPARPTPENVLGILSLICWSLVIVVCVKYVGFLLRADYDGQGGTLALLAQLIEHKRAATPAGLGALALIVLFGSSMLYGDGAITPAISVISAIEGLDVWTTSAHRYIVPIAAILLIALFVSQKRGTGKIGALFGPIMLCWFAAIGVAGAVAVFRYPHVLQALGPSYAIGFCIRNGFRSLLIFGAVVLCVTGAEALYADLSHFGRKPITLAWAFVVFPALLLNYFGQGALTLNDPKAVSNPFYLLVPHHLIIPMVLLSTVATIIASQALISGVFSLTQQAMQLGYVPRFRTIHTSRHFAGQIYMPTVNVLLAIVCLMLVFTFRSSERLGGAYGLAVTVTMLTTTVAFSQLLIKNWKWRVWQWLPLVALFFALESAFLIGNASKFVSGGWVPFLMALALFTLFTTWNRGRRRMMIALGKLTMPVNEFLREMKAPTVISGTAFFLSPEPQGIPFMLHHQWLRNHIASDTVVLLTIMHASRPFVHPQDRLEIEEMAPRLLRVKAWYGFMQQPKIKDILYYLRRACPEIDLSRPTYYLAAPKIRESHAKGRLPGWQRTLFRVMARNAPPLTDSLGLPPNSTIEFGVEAPL
jgi:KUP system potassium uptake protein